MLSRLAQISIGVAAALCASPAVSENWVKLGTSDNGTVWSIDKDSIRRGNDELVYFTDETSSNDGLDTSDEAIDCQKRILYTLKINDLADPDDWRQKGHAIATDSAADAVLKYVCANAG
jgi:hypothetical protein